MIDLFKKEKKPKTNMKDDRGGMTLIIVIAC